MVERQLSIFLQNKPGVLAEVCRVLSGTNINLRAISVSDTVDHAVVRLVVDNPQKAVHLLGERGTLVVETDVLAVRLTNKPGALGEVARKLGRAGVNIEYAYGSADAAEGVLFLRVSNLGKARKALSARSSRR
ncbi:MAG: ACT domain-containing protein [Planctomycetes bacterium]|nr:ACT domain-containing protein [Planctomycetota bacterium]